MEISSVNGLSKITSENKHVSVLFMMQDRKDMREKNIQPQIYGDVKIETQL